MPRARVIHKEQTPGLGMCGREGDTSTITRRVTCKACRRKPRQDWMHQADQLFSRMVRERDGSCVRCGSTDRLQCAHIISRSYHATRVDEDNAVALCQGCHVFFTHRPLEWIDFIEARHPGRYEVLRVRALSGVKVDWQAEVARLTSPTGSEPSF